jgi:hypothetical protein
MKAQSAAKYVIRHLIAAAAAATPLSPLSPVAAIASATPPIGISSVVLSKQTVNGKDYIVSDITIAPGGSTGWHTHQGAVFGIVKSGTLTRNIATAASKVSAIRRSHHRPHRRRPRTSAATGTAPSCWK